VNIDGAITPVIETSGWVDWTGLHYEFERTTDGCMVAWRLFYSKVLVGYLFLHRRAEGAFIADLEVRESVTQRSRLRRLLGLKGRELRLRRRGLGSMLLQTAIGYSRRSGARRLSGEVTREDLQRSPSLVEWYQRHGFLFTPLHDDTRLAGRIEMVFTLD
jgi:GNAT superfamily N-acetyltransferase